MKRRGGASTAAEISRIRLPLAGRVEDHREERVALVALEIRSVRRPHHAVAEAVRGRLELHRNEALAHARLVDAAPLLEHVVDQPLADDQRQELVQDDPVVVPCRHPPRLLERRIRIPVRSRPVDRPVVEANECALQPRNHQVLVVTRIGHDRRAARVARQILEHPARLDP
jgi:hypothetical protein